MSIVYWEAQTQTQIEGQQILKELNSGAELIIHHYFNVGNYENIFLLGVKKAM